MIHRRVYSFSLAIACAIVALPAMVAAQGTPQAPAQLTYSVNTFPTVTGTSRAVHSGDNLQNVLNAAQAGDEVVIDAGTTFTGQFQLPVRCGSDPGWIIVRSSALSSLPAGTRVGPSNASSMPKLVTNTVPYPALQTQIYTSGCFAQKYWIAGLELTAQASLDFNGDLVMLGDPLETDPTHMARNVYLDRCYIHGLDGLQATHGIRLEAASLAIVNSYVANFKATVPSNRQGQAILSVNGVGPFQITNNYIEGSGENALFGGDDPATCTGPSGCQVISDITFTRNTVEKLLSWRVNDPSYGGHQWCIGNLFELKNAQHVLVDGNDFENSWWSGCDGNLSQFSVVLTPRNQDGNDPQAVVQDVQFSNNYVRHVPGGFNLLARDDQSGHSSQYEQRILISNNVVDDLTTAWNDGTNGAATARMFMLSPPSTNYTDGITAPKYVTIDHNTFVNPDPSDNSYLYVDCSPCTAQHMPNFTFTNNIVAEVTYGVMGASASPDATGNASSTFNLYFDGTLAFTNNAIVGATGTSYTASGGFPGNVSANQFPAAWSNVGFVNFNNGSGGDYHLSSSSPYLTAGTGGSALGANIDTLNEHQPGGGCDCTPPTASITAPSNNASVSGTVSVTATASDTGGSGLARVEFWLDGTTKIGTATSSPYTVSWDTTPVANGTHTLVARAFDGAGNEGDSSSVSVTVQNSTGGGESAVTWTNAVNAAVTSNSIQKTAGCDGCQDAGGVTSDTISAAGQFFEFTPVVTGTIGPSFYAGLTQNPGTPPSSTQLAYSFSIWPNNTWEVREGDVYKTDGAFSAGATFRIAIEAGPVVTYSINGAVVYTSATAPSGSYALGTALLVNGVSVSNAMVSGGGTTLPTGWSNGDVGTTGIAGSASYATSTGTFTVNGAGANIWSTADSFQFVYETMSGDGQIIAHVASFTNTTSTHAKAGLMIRTSLDPGAPEVTADFEPGQMESLSRQTQGGTTTAPGGGPQTVPGWLKIVRSGANVSVYNSSDGVTWTANGSVTLPTGTAYIGLVVCSHDTTNVATATFDNVSR